jgi:hypothetical protein
MIFWHASKRWNFKNLLAYWNAAGKPNGDFPGLFILRKMA